MATQLPLVALTLFCLTGAGIYIASAIGYFKGNGGEIRPPALIASTTFLALTLVVTTLLVGNPARIFNILGHVVSGFSMAMVASFILMALSIYLIALDYSNSHGTKNRMVTIIAVVIAVIACYGVSLTYLKPSRPALFNWSVPLYLISFMLTVGSFGYSAILTLTKEEQDTSIDRAKLITLIIQLVAVLGFIVNAGIINGTDRYLTQDMLLTGVFAPLLYIIVIICGLILPFIYEVALRRAHKSNIFACLVFLLVMIGGLGFSVILNASTTYVRKLI